MAKKEKYFVVNLGKENPLNSIGAIYAQSEIDNKETVFDNDDILYEIALTGKKFKIETSTKLVEVK